MLSSSIPSLKFIKINRFRVSYCVLKHSSQIEPFKDYRIRSDGFSQELVALPQHHPATEIAWELDPSPVIYSGEWHITYPFCTFIP